MANDIDNFMAMDALELAKNDEAIAGVIAYIRRHRGNVEEGKKVTKEAGPKLTGLASKLAELKASQPQPPKPTIAQLGLRRL